MRLSSFLLFCFAASLGVFFAFNEHAYETPRSYPKSIAPISQTATQKSTLDKNPTYQKGKQLFKNNCAQCHNKNMRDDLTASALAGVSQRWEGRTSELYAWIRNSSQLIAAKDPYAVKLYQKWNRLVMNPFPNLSDEDIAALLVYIEGTR